MNEIPTDAEIEKHIDIIPIVIILMCRITVKYNLDINWLINTIVMGYNNELPPEPDMNGVQRYDS
jgi:hypothetical protein